MGKQTDETIVIEDSQPEDDVELLDEDDDDEEEDEMFDFQELMDCLKSDEGQTVGESVALLAQHMESQNKLLVKLISQIKKPS
mgnify:CR=1 FL=1